MNDLLRDYYESRVYPAMSHPLSDPAVSAVAALFGGLKVPHPAGARILEIGCSSGHNLIPLALRWPRARFLGIDLSGRAIQDARSLAAAASAENVEFQAADIRDFDPAGETFDFIIAHGVFSWVPDEVKVALLRFCRSHLAPSGIATISFNLECGWLPRFPVIEKVRAIQQAGAADEMSALAILRSVTDPGSPELAVIDDMLAKGPGILPFDDFAPVNDPWPLEQFVQTAAAAGLRWLCESDPGKNLPGNLDAATLERLRKNTTDPLAFQCAADATAGRTFRSGLLCRDDAEVGTQISLERVFDVFVRSGVLGPLDADDQQILQTIALHAPHCISMEEVRAALPEFSHQYLARRVYDGIHAGWILPRIEAVEFETEPSARPVLPAFRLECARRRLPLVDLWHQPCSFPDQHFEVLAAMDGTRDQAALAKLARECCPDLHFEPWLRHLAGRGMFA